MAGDIDVGYAGSMVHHVALRPALPRERNKPASFRASGRSIQNVVVLCALTALVGCPRGNDPIDDPLDADPEDAIRADCAALDDELGGVERPAGWDPLIHCKRAVPNVEAVFGGVPKLTITMSAAEYAAMQADLDELTGGGGGGGGDDPFLVACEGKAIDDVCAVDAGGGPEDGVCVDFDGLLACIPNSFRPPQEWIDVCAGVDEGSACTTSDHDGVCFFDGLSFACFPVDGGPGPGPGQTELPCLGQRAGEACANAAGAGVCAETAQDGFLVCVVDGFDDANLASVPLEAAAPFWEREPAYFHADLTFQPDGGAPATFTSVGIRYKGNNGLATSSGEKRPLRLKLDEWEDERPAITDQRLFGFQHLSLAPNHTDPSNLHQVLAAAIFRDNGVPAPQAGFVEVELDTGDGPRLIGVYAITEIPDNPLLERAFGSDEGNLYKPDGRGAHFRAFHAESMHKENNDDAPFDDVVAFVEALNGPSADRALWRTRLEETFDMAGFTQFYAVNQLIGNWDTYGGFAHNFYLYGDPDRAGQLRFIAWDFDLAFDGTGPSDLTLQSFDGSWPLVQAVARDPVYFVRYHEQLRAAFDAEFVDGALAARIDDLVVRVGDAIDREDVVHEGVRDAFDDGVAGLENHVRFQEEAVRAHLAGTGF